MRKPRRAINARNSLQVIREEAGAQAISGGFRFGQPRAGDANAHRRAPAQPHRAGQIRLVQGHLGRQEAG